MLSVIPFDIKIWIINVDLIENLKFLPLGERHSIFLSAADKTI